MQLPAEESEMKDEAKTKEQLISELRTWREQAAKSKRNKGVPSDRIDLRSRAEERLRGTQKEPHTVRTDDTERLMHELRVHQVELEMQNEELRRILVELEKSRDRYSHLYDFSPVGYVMLNEEGIIQDANLTLAAMLGLERRTLKGKYLTRFIQRDHQDTFYLHRNRVLETETPKSCDVRLVKSDAQEFYAHLECMIVKESDGDFKQIRCAVSDITERKQMEEELCIAHDKLEILVQERTAELHQANDELKTEISERKQGEAALRKSEERFRSLVSAMSQVVWTTNPQGEVVDDMPSWRAFTGQSKEDAQGFGWSEMVHPEDRRRVLEIWNQAVESKTVYDTEYRLRRYDGEYRDVLVRGIPVLEKDGSIREWVGTCTDISVRKRSENELRESEKRLRFLSAKLMTAQEEERKTIARELHDSIGSSLAFLKFSVEKALDLKPKNNPEPVVKSLESLLPAIQNTIEEARRICMALRPSILDDLGVVAAIDWFCRNFKGTYTNIHIDKWIGLKEEEIPESLKIAIFRIIQEALNNVAKYSKAELLDLALVRSGEAIELIIEDYGVGFDLDMISSARDNNCGLGLTSMKERAELSGGELMIQSTLGSGTRIRVFWPGRMIELK